MKWQASAPSNIALIKYMGKSNEQLNLPTNASLSYTLNHLRSTVELELTNATTDQWQPFPNTDIQLSEKEQQRFIKHLRMLKNYFNCEQHFIIRSSNNFPAACGLASSASSFAALTQCAANAFNNLSPETFDKLNITIETLALLSRLGSGSSCRSFYNTWSIWRADKTEAIKLPYYDLIHHTVVVSQHKKAISSSEAHRKVLTSELFHGRAERAEKRLQQLVQSLLQHDWYSAYKICWQEFWDMHALFETCAEPFSYFVPNSLIVLNYLRDFWKNKQDGPLITMDAGPNVHLLFRPDQSHLITEIKQQLNSQFDLI